MRASQLSPTDVGGNRQGKVWEFNTPDLPTLVRMVDREGTGILEQLRGYMLYLCPDGTTHPEIIADLKDRLDPKRFLLVSLQGSLFLRIGPRLPGQKFWRITVGVTPPTPRKASTVYPTLADSRDLIDALPDELVKHPDDGPITWPVDTETGPLFD